MAKDSIQALRNYNLDTAPSELLIEAAFVIAHHYMTAFT